MDSSENKISTSKEIVIISILTILAGTNVTKGCFLPRSMVTFNIQDQIVGGGVADKALGGDAPEVGLGIQLWGKADAASHHDHAAGGTQAALLQQLEVEFVFPHSRLKLLIFLIYLLKRDNATGALITWQ